MRRIATAILLVLISLGVACGGGGSSPTSPSPSSSPTPAPTPAPAPTPTSVSLTGFVTVTGTSVRLNGATIRILDGPNVGRTTTTANSGTYRFEDMIAGNANVSASASGWEEQRTGVNVDGTNTLNFTMRTIAPWSPSGTGNNVFDKPAWVTRVRITGSYTGFSSNFIVWCGNSLIVNELLGTGWSRTRYDGTHSVSGCTEVRVKDSTGVSWTMTEVR